LVFDCFFECVSFSDVVRFGLFGYFAKYGNWLAEPCPNDAYVEELISTKTTVASGPVNL